jgi:hypothetical protein
VKCIGRLVEYVGELNRRASQMGMVSVPKELVLTVVDDPQA